jgi:hypothetical protein
MGIFTNIFKKNKPVISPLKEEYPEYCIETINNRAYLEEFFDVKNNALMQGQKMQVIPNCSHCCAQYHCAIGVHVINYMRYKTHIQNYPAPVDQIKNAGTADTNKQTSKEKESTRFDNLVE